MDGATKAFELNLGSSKIYQEADLKAGGTQIVQGLRNVFIFQHGYCLQYNQHLFFR